MEAEESYRLKKVQVLGKTIPLIMQNINGPCPLLGICNVLLLRGNIRIHPDFSMVDYGKLVGLLGDCLLSQEKPIDVETLENYNQSVADAVALFPTLQFGLDVNVRFRRWVMSSLLGYRETHTCCLGSLTLSSRCNSVYSIYSTFALFMAGLLTQKMPQPLIPLESYHITKQ